MHVIIFSYLKVVFYGSLGVYNNSTASSSEGWTLGIICVAMVSLLFMLLFLFSPACFLDRWRRPLRRAKSGTRRPSFSFSIRATGRKAEKSWTKLSESGATSVQVVSMRCQSSMGFPWLKIRLGSPSGKTDAKLQLNSIASLCFGNPKESHPRENSGEFPGLLFLYLLQTRSLFVPTIVMKRSA